MSALAVWSVVPTCAPTEPAATGPPESATSEVMWAPPDPLARLRASMPVGTVHPVLPADRALQQDSSHIPLEGTVVVGVLTELAVTTPVRAAAAPKAGPAGLVPV